jgi:L-aspartate oxidase
MKRYDDRGELAPRDIVSRAIAQELLSREENHVLLDATQVDQEEFMSHFPMINETCLSVGIDPSKEGIPVVPAAHYSCGGIEVDYHGASSLKGLFAIGECSHTGLHGANRLASNSLLEAIVYAHRAAVYSAESLNQELPNQRFYDQIPEWNGQEYSSDLKLTKTQKLFKELQHVMSNKAGIFKTNEGLEQASIELNNLYKETLDLYRKNKLTPQLCELRNMVSVAYLLINQALEIKENKGVFYNNDYA